MHWKGTSLRFTFIRNRNFIVTSLLSLINYHSRNKFNTSETSRLFYTQTSTTHTTNHTVTFPLSPNYYNFLTGKGPDALADDSRSTELLLDLTISLLFLALVAACGCLCGYVHQVERKYAEEAPGSQVQDPDSAPGEASAASAFSQAKLSCSCRRSVRQLRLQRFRQNVSRMVAETRKAKLSPRASKAAEPPAPEPSISAPEPTGWFGEVWGQLTAPLERLVPRGVLAWATRPFLAQPVFMFGPEESEGVRNRFAKSTSPTQTEQVSPFASLNRNHFRELNQSRDHSFLMWQ
jgi:hypothetical protein